MINKFRRILIYIGKILPFVICCIVMLNYIECLIALKSNDFAVYDDYVILNTDVSFYINKFVEYNIQTLVVLSIISIAIETCIYNKLTCVYLGINLFEKSYFDFELEPTAIYVICVCNIVVACYLIHKGIKIIIK